MTARARRRTAAPERIAIPGGPFRMGSDRHYPEEAPAREATVAPFWIDAYPVTNAGFAAFVKATGWVTAAEQPPKAEDYPGALPDMLVPASLVFTPTPHAVPLNDAHRWWRYTPGANWRAPTGPGSTLAGLWDHPVVHVAWDDVQAYLHWAGADLPTEAEWEFAARGGLDGAEFAWGDEWAPGGVTMANVWEGPFPHASMKPGARMRTTPVGSYPPNPYGLYDMIGNVWEWTKDWWANPSETAVKSCCATARPQTEMESDSCDPRDTNIRIPRKVLKGGSHLCAPSYCRRYRPAARHPHPVDTPTSHIGFRCVWRTQA